MSLSAVHVVSQRQELVKPPVQRVLDRLVSVPVDIEPRFVTAAALAAR
jgi:hypothetical protein